MEQPPLRCRIGFHKWVEVRRSDPGLDSSARSVAWESKCRYCGRRCSENEMGAYCDLLHGADGAAEFAINLNVLPKGSPMAIYHHEPHREGFLVLRGECAAIIDGTEVALQQWDYFHCAPDVRHVVVSASDEPALVLANRRPTDSSRRLRSSPTL